MNLERRVAVLEGQLAALLKACAGATDLYAIRSVADAVQEFPQNFVKETASHD
jgi:hypothetical protein